MKAHVKLIVGSVLALVLGLTVSLPMLFANLALVKKVKIGVDVVYAYFGVQELNKNVTGLWRNLTSPWELHLISYFIVLNVTNHSNDLALMQTFEAFAAPEITVQNGTETEIIVQNGTERIGSQNMTESANATGDFAFSIKDPIVTGFLDGSRTPFFDQYWSANGSRLIGLSGIVQVSDPAYTALTKGIMYLLGKVEGRAYGGAYSMGFSLKHVQLQMIGREFLYNSAVSENQILQIDSNGIDVHIGMRR
jgi:hypothetical protein